MTTAVQLYTLKEAARHLKLAPGTLRNWLSQDRIPCTRIPSVRAVKFSADDLAEIISKGPRPPKAKRAPRKPRTGPGRGKDHRLDAIMSQACSLTTSAYAVPKEASNGN